MSIGHWDKFMNNLNTQAEIVNTILPQMERQYENLKEELKYDVDIFLRNSNLVTLVRLKTTLNELNDALVKINLLEEIRG